MENLLGLLRIKVIRGINLAKRDARSSDPYVVVKMGKQKLKTHTVKKNVNPEWNEELTLSISDSNVPITLKVYDKDIFSMDDIMGDAEFEIHAFVEALKVNLPNLPNGTVITKVRPNRENCLSDDSCVVWENGRVIQHMILRLRNVECGEIELQLNWIDIPGSRGLK
ncbi:Protein C2-DOMAIN ABA-RELATED 4 [Orobanche gracilis]